MKKLFAILCFAVSVLSLSTEAQTVDTSSCNWTVTYQQGNIKVSALNCQNLGTVLTKTENLYYNTCSLSPSSGYTVTGTCGQFTLTRNQALILTLPTYDADGAFTVSWTSVSGATSYILEDAFNGVWNSQPKTLSGLSYSYGASKSGTYSFRVKACSSSGCSSVSSTKNITVELPTAPPPVPAFVRVSAPYIQNVQSGTVTWASVTGAAYYEVQQYFPSPNIYSPGSPSGWYFIYRGGNTSYSFEHPNQQFRARSCNLAGCSQWVYN